MSAPLFSRHYHDLGERFGAAVAPTPVRDPHLIRYNATLGAALGMDADWAVSQEGLGLFSGNALPPSATPVAQAYAGHQFGHFAPQLGDGRALLIGEVEDQDGQLQEVALKGSGRTPFSRGGDGRAALGPALREYLLSEAMHRLGVPTTRALAVVASGEAVYRETPLPGAVLTRVAPSFLRVGSFAYFGARGMHAELATLTSLALKRHYPHAQPASAPALTLLYAAITAQAELVAHWMSLGFIHGVMNSDNAHIGGLTLDYGPCAYLEAFNPAQHFSAIDSNGRYAWQNQPHMAQWNLTRLAEALLPLIDEDETTAVSSATTALETFSPRFNEAFLRRFAAKFGVKPEAHAFIDESLTLMAEIGVDFTSFFSNLTDIAAGDPADPLFSLAHRAQHKAALRDWVADWERNRDSGETPEKMRRHNPYFIARNHQVEAALQAADQGDYAPFHRLYERLQSPFSWDEADADLAQPADESHRVTQTFCGT